MTLPLLDNPRNGDISHSGNKAKEKEKKTVATFFLTKKFSQPTSLLNDQERENVDLKQSCSVWR